MHLSLLFLHSTIWLKIYFFSLKIAFFCNFVSTNWFKSQFQSQIGWFIMSHKVVTRKKVEFLVKCRLPLKRTFCVLIRKIMKSMDRSHCLFSNESLDFYFRLTVGEGQTLILDIHFRAIKYDINLPQLFLLPPRCPYFLQQQVATVT